MSEPARPLIVLKPQQYLTQEMMCHLRAHAERLIDDLSYDVLVVEHGLDAQVHSDVAPLVKAIERQTQAIDALAESNMALVDAMTQLDEDDGAGATTYLDDTPRK
ncbi:hypothetical protein ACJO2E_02500 [Marinobacter sp. M1N3S26]|uniref:hypothetical protein n=1 Tax=Marinobacter sp. M1N3S26 TaxID=3382299 RepID=UPI00387A9421